MLDASTTRGRFPFLPYEPVSVGRPHLLTQRADRKHSVPIDFQAYKALRAQRYSSLTNGTSSTSPVASLQTESIAQSISSSAVLPGNEQTADSSEPPAPYPTSFSEIVELISKGLPVPGIKEIPDTVLEGQASRPIASERRKPWEKVSEDGAGAGAGEHGPVVASSP